MSAKISPVWGQRKMRMNAYKLAIALMVFLCLAVAAIVTVAALALADKAEASHLPDSLQTEVWKLEAAGKMTAADSLKRVFTAKLQLDQRQKAAQAELAKKKAEAQKKIWAQWNQEVTPMTLDSVWIWAGKDAGKIGWLATRYNFRLDPQVPTEAQLPTMKGELEARKKLRAEVSRQLGTVNDRVDKLAKRVDQAEQGIAAVRTAVVQNKFDIQAALSVLERVAVGTCPDSNTVQAIKIAKEANSRH